MAGQKGVDFVASPSAPSPHPVASRPPSPAGGRRNAAPPRQSQSPFGLPRSALVLMVRRA